MILRAFLLLVTCALAGPRAFALSDGARELVRYETQANGAAKQNPGSVLLEHYEIPLSHVSADLSPRLDPAVRDSLLFTRDGETFLRWVVHPEDTRYHPEIERRLRERGLSTERHRYFRAYRTASRSLIVEDPVSQAEFSLKVSTNLLLGKFAHKKHTEQNAMLGRQVTDYVRELGEAEPFRHFSVLDESAAFGLSGLEQGFSVRSLGALSKGDVTYLPAFSALHEETGRSIAEKNGAKDVAAFWDEHLNRPLGRALAELAARTGLTYNSPHSQNFLIELDRDGKPTGRIVLRDLTDVELTPELLRGKTGAALATLWPVKKFREGKIPAAVGLLQKNVHPSWLGVFAYDKWGQSFFNAYEEELARQTGADPKLFPRFYSSRESFFEKDFSVKGADWQPYLRKISEGEAHPPVECPAFYSHL